MYKFSLLLFVFLGVNNLFALPDWELISEKDNIKVYSKIDSNTGLKIYKAEMVVNTSENRVIEVLNDIRTYHKWTPKLEDIKLLKQVNNGELYYYSTFKTPVVSNRDLIVHLKTYKTGNSTFIKMEGAPNFIPQKEGYVRMPAYYGVYKIEPINSSGVNVSLEYQADPGGNLPVWMVNSSSDEIPMQMFLNLKALF